MDADAAAEQAKYARVWNFPAYRRYSPGEDAAPRALATWDWLVGDTVLDWGCGRGQAVNKFCDAGLFATGIDFVRPPSDVLTPSRFLEACLWDLPGTLPAKDFSFSADVLEHLPPDRVEAVIANMARLTLRAAYVQIATVPDRMGPALIGESLHLTVRDHGWWYAQLIRHFQFVTPLASARPMWAVFRCRGRVGYPVAVGR